MHSPGSARADDVDADGYSSVEKAGPVARPLWFWRA